MRTRARRYEWSPKAFRKHLGDRSIVEIAADVGVSVEAVRQWTLDPAPGGRPTEPLGRSALRVADLLGVRLEDLYVRVKR